MNILKSFSFSFVIGFLLVHVDVWGGQQKNVMPILLGTVGAGVGVSTTFTQQFLPQLLFFTTATSPDINIKVSGDGTIWDVPGIGVNELATVRQLSRTSNFYLLQLATGLVKGKMVTYTITNQTAVAFNVYGSSKVSPVGSSLRYFCANSQVCLAGSGFTFGNFMYLSMANAGATDRYVITYKDGTSQPIDSRDELKSVLQLYQNSISSVGYNIDSVASEVSMVQVVPAAQQTAYVYYQQPVGMAVNNLAFMP